MMLQFHGHGKEVRVESLRVEVKLDRGHCGTTVGFRHRGITYQFSPLFDKLLVHRHYSQPGFGGGTEYRIHH